MRTGRRRVTEPLNTASSSPSPPALNWLMELTITSPFSTATPESAMNPMAATNESREDKPLVGEIRTPLDGVGLQSDPLGVEGQHVQPRRLAGLQPVFRELQQAIVKLDLLIENLELCFQRLGLGVRLLHLGDDVEGDDDRFGSGGVKPLVGGIHLSRTAK